MYDRAPPPPPPPPATAAERVRSHAGRQKAQGLKRVSVWVPAEQVEALRTFAAGLRQKASAPLPLDRTTIFAAGKIV